MWLCLCDGSESDIKMKYLLIVIWRLNIQDIVSIGLWRVTIKLHGNFYGTKNLQWSYRPRSFVKVTIWFHSLSIGNSSQNIYHDNFTMEFPNDVTRHSRGDFILKLRGVSSQSSCNGHFSLECPKERKNEIGEKYRISVY